ncbi:DUF302 domain-containing protein [Sphingomonas sp. AR_OL41]|uniref:DUF302 domain-containing protein n=1 Tax=Sphingomonas sp. AR_OL41 TaxID=3042729 RepID=UPI0024802D41|nr:DUF302 domain-containing protein [Sphingomonas sp. AR_OL41]MDH7972835.1 DUF302 domain-containing protein [Sphingomonas sp. AR_OL41]
MPKGMISVASVGTFAATVDRLDTALHDRGIAPMLRLDHQAAAAAVGLSLRPLLLLLFGDPRVGTVLMQENPTTGIDLPLKLLLWESGHDEVWVGYNDPAWIRARHGLSQPPAASFKMAALLHDLALRAAGKTTS